MITTPLSCNYLRDAFLARADKLMAEHAAQLPVIAEHVADDVVRYGSQRIDTDLEERDNFMRLGQAQGFRFAASVTPELVTLAAMRSAIITLDGECYASGRLRPSVDCWEGFNEGLYDATEKLLFIYPGSKDGLEAARRKAHRELKDAYERLKYR